SVLALAALAIGTAAAPAARARTFNVSCDAAALESVRGTASANDEEDVVWLAPGCVYPLIFTWTNHPDDGFPVTIRGQGATISGSGERRAFIVLAGSTLYLEDLKGADGFTIGDGGAIYNEGWLTIAKSTVSDSEARTGGGIFNAENATLTVVESTISGNTASEDGGGIRNRKGRLTLIRSTVSGNAAKGSSGDGGGILNDNAGSGAQATATLTNCTVSGNSARFGAGVFNDEGPMVVNHCTFSDNTALGGGNGGAIYHRNYFGSGALTLGNSILANTHVEVGGAYDCVRDPFLPETAITPSGGNLIEDGSCEVVGAFAADPKLGRLSGGPASHPLLPGSPAIDLAQNPNCPGVDQRGAPRPVDGNGDGFVICDLGAFEAGP